MKKPWQRVCPNCHQLIEWYPYPKQTEMEYKWRPVIPCWRCGARLRKTKAQLALQLLLSAIGIYLLFAFSWGWIAFLAGWIVGWLVFVQLKLEIMDPGTSGRAAGNR